MSRDPELTTTNAGSSPVQELELRLKRAEALLRVPSQIRSDQPLGDVLATLSENIVRETGAVAAALLLLRPEDLSAVAIGSSNLPPGYIEAMVATHVEPARAESLRKVINSEAPHIARSARETMLAIPELGHLRELIRQAPFDTYVTVPFLNRPEVAGIVCLYFAEGVDVDAGEVAFARAVAEQAAPVMDNAWLFSRVQRRTDELEALYRADEALHRSLQLGDVLEAMVDLAIELLGASSSLVVTWDETDRLGIRCARGIGPAHRGKVHNRYQELTREYFKRFEPPYAMSLIEDVESHPGLSSYKTRLVNPGSLAEIPVMVGGELWGFFSIGWRNRRTFDDDDRRLFDAFAARASLAIQNANFFEQAQEAASLEERRRLARDLHDSVSQALYGIGLGGRTAKLRLGDTAPTAIVEPIDYIIQLAESGLAETRALIFELIPESLQEQGLVVALQRQAIATQARHRVDVEVDLEAEPEISLRAKEALYRIAQESLNNMAKHAQAARARLRLSTVDGLVTLVVGDDGKGFDTGGDFPGHFGLRSMDERARRLGGRCTVESVPGVGTTVTVVLPATASAVEAASAPGSPDGSRSGNSHA